MTSKLTITREENVQAVFDLKAGYTLGLADVEILKRVARMAMVAMESEPVAWTSETALNDVSCEETSMIGKEGVVGNIPLYRHAQSPVVPDGSLIAELLTIAKEAADDADVFAYAEFGNKSMRHTTAIADWECRAAMLQAGNSPVIPDEMTAEQAHEIGDYHGDPVDVFARGANWMRQHIIDSTLAAAPQSPGSEPATVPGKWIPVSERMPEVGDIVLTAMGGVVNVGEMECSAANCRFFTSVISGRELPATHWMPLPAAPQEEKP